MIEAVVKYSKKTFKGGRELFIYKDIVIKGHSSDGTINSIKCCAGVTAITCGLINLLEYGNKRYCSVEINKGYFHYQFGSQYNAEINYAINALIYQLDSIQMTYPTLFKDIQFIEEKNNEEN